MWINHKLIRECLQELSDQEMQNRLWLSAGPPEVSSFIETAEQLYGDSGLRDALQVHATSFGPELESLFLKLDGRLVAMDHTREPGKIIDDPAMVPVRELARTILSRLPQSET